MSFSTVDFALNFTVRPNLDDWLLLVAQGHHQEACARAADWLVFNHGSAFADTPEAEALWASMGVDSKPAEALRALFDCGADPAAATQRGETGWALAATSPTPHFLRIFLECRAPSGEEAVVALERAIRVGRDPAAALLAPLADLGLYRQLPANRTGESALLGAASAGLEACVSALLLREDPREKDARGDDAFERAFQAMQWRCVDILSPFADSKRVRGAVDDAPGRESLPLACARLEREELLKITQAAGRVSFSTGSRAASSAEPSTGASDAGANANGEPRAVRRI